MDADDHPHRRWLTVRATWEGDHYADHTAHHRTFDDVLLSRLRPLPVDAAILDVGCGVGDFTAGLVDRVPGGSVRGLDADASMIQTARQLHASTPRLTFDVLAAQQLAQAAPAGSVHAIVSSACLHWVPEADHPAVLAGARQVLVPGGQWCVEFGGHGQVAALREVLDPLAKQFGGGPPRWFFPDEHRYRTLLEDAGFEQIEVSLIHQQRPMADAQALRGLLTSQVLVAYLDDIAVDDRATFVDQACDAVVASVEQGHSPSGEAGERAVNYDVAYVRVVASAVNPL